MHSWKLLFEQNIQYNQAIWLFLNDNKAKYSLHKMFKYPKQSAVAPVLFEVLLSSPSLLFQALPYLPLLFLLFHHPPAVVLQEDVQLLPELLLPGLLGAAQGTAGGVRVAVQHELQVLDTPAGAKCG